MKLTDLKCKSAKPREKSYKMFDGGGLYLEVMPGGSKHWRYKFFEDGKEKRLSFGRYPDVPLKEARERRQQARILIDRGESPAPKSAARRLTFEALAQEWLEHNRDRWSEKTHRTNGTRLAMHVYPLIGQMALDEIRPLHMLDLMRRMRDRGTPEMGRRVRDLCDAVFRLGIVTERCESNPAAAVRGIVTTPAGGHMAAFDKTALPAFLSALNSNSARLYPHTLAAIRLLLLTFVRTGELIGARWEEIDEAGAQWLIPPERMKMKRAHLVPLSRQALTVIDVLRAIRQNEWLLPSPIRHNQHVSNGIVLMGLRRLGYGGEMTGHGFRSLAKSTILEELPGYTEDIIERQLAHAPRGAYGEAYNRAQYLEQRRQMMQDWADYIDRQSPGGVLIPANRTSGTLSELADILPH